jgi:hypothetical protein
MRIEIVLFLFCLIPAATFAQQDYLDVLYLKDSTVIKGEIIKQVFNKEIVILNQEWDTLYYNANQIEKLLRVEDGMDTINHIPMKYWPHRQLILQYGYFFGCGEYSNNFHRISVVNGFRFNRTFSLGLGIGLSYTPQEMEVASYYVVSGTERKSIPAFLDFRLYFNPTEKLGEYFTLDLGYSFIGPYNSYFFFSPSIGFVSKSKPSIHFGLGYELDCKEFEIIETAARYHIPSFPTKSISYVSIDVGINF